jgi:hypothetical protein
VSLTTVSHVLNAVCVLLQPAKLACIEYPREPSKDEAYAWVCLYKAVWVADAVLGMRAQVGQHVAYSTYDLQIVAGAACTLQYMTWLGLALVFLVLNLSLLIQGALGMAVLGMAGVSLTLARPVTTSRKTECRSAGPYCTAAAAV